MDMSGLVKNNQKIFGYIKINSYFRTKAKI